MVELVDTLVSGTSESNLVEVQVLFSASKSPRKRAFLRAESAMDLILSRKNGTIRIEIE